MPARALVVCLFFALMVSACGEANTRNGTPEQTERPASGTLVLASTTSTQDSGLLDALIPEFERATGVTVKLISGGSGQAIELAKRGDVDALLVHSPDAELKMVADGHGIERAAVMHNDFVLVGPPDDPAGVRGAADITAAMGAIATRGGRFVSRGDDSGTHVVERKLWADAGVEPSRQGWYEETGQGQGATLQIAAQRRAYALTDRGTFLAQRERLDLALLYEGSPLLLNYYHVIVVNPAKHPGVNAGAARAWAAWILGEEAQRIIAGFGISEFGQPLFIPDAGKPEPASR